MAVRKARPGRPLGQQRLALDLELAAQRVDLLEREPALAAVGLDLPRGEGGVGGKTAAEGRLVEAQDQLRHLPGGEAAQRLLILGGEGLLADPALHLERARLEHPQILVREHGLPRDVNSALLPRIRRIWCFCLPCVCVSNPSPPGRPVERAGRRAAAAESVPKPARPVFSATRWGDTTTRAQDLERTSRRIDGTASVSPNTREIPIFESGFRARYLRLTQNR